MFVEKVVTRVMPTVVFFTFALGGCAEPPDSEAAPPGVQVPEVSAPILPNGGLVVYVVVDQLRADLLDRYQEVFVGGLARLLQEGLRFSNATFDHAQTSTSPGHGTAATGTHPHRHGLVGNNWEERLPDGSWESVYALRDLSTEIVGYPEMEGRGPANLDRQGLPDWIMAADPGARVVSLSGKDRAAIAMAGHVRGDVYWLDSGLGRFITSTYYRDKYPDWLEDFHNSDMPRLWADTVWHSEVPVEAARLSRPDTFPYEGDGVNTYFPHRASREAGGESEHDLNEWRGRGPYPDQATIALAKGAVEELDLGQRGVLDYLSVALSQVDRVGHDYGPLSREQLDNLIRLDRELGSFLDFLDAQLGEDGWVLALTADHGVMDLPEAREQAGEYGRRISPDERRAMISRAEAAAEAAGGDPLERARAAAQAALESDWVEDAFAWEDLFAGAEADTLRALFAHSYHPERALPPLGHLGVALRTVEGAYSGRYPTGTGHGSPYYFDRHVPFILRVPGLSAGTNFERVSIVDLAPTLASLLEIPFPADLDGRPVVRVHGRN